MNRRKALIGLGAGVGVTTALVTRLTYYSAFLATENVQPIEGPGRWSIACVGAKEFVVS